MRLYVVTVTYTIGSSSVVDAFQIRRKAASPGAAIAAVTAAFNSLCNVRTRDPVDPTISEPWLKVTNVTAAEVT